MQPLWYFHFKNLFPISGFFKKINPKLTEFWTIFVKTIHIQAPEVATEGVLYEKMFLEISQN